MLFRPVGNQGNNIFPSVGAITGAVSMLQRSASKSLPFEPGLSAIQPQKPSNE